MKIVITESQFNKLIKEIDNKNSGESWFYQNTCISKQFPNIKLTGSFAKYEMNNQVWVIERNGLLDVTIKMINSGQNRYGDTHKYGKWWCNPNNNKFEFKINSNNTQSKIPQAKTMDDVKNNRGYIIKGMMGPIVKELQKMLINLGYDLGSQKDDGIFGDTTKNAVETFQKDSGIKPKNDVYGIFGKITYDKIMNKSN
jgi:N-acetylmuramoyl-L-alanine amidase